jgi:hypothetical protein
LAKYGHNGRLHWYRSHHYANRDALRRAIRGLLDDEPEVTELVIEGGGPLAMAWRKASERRGIHVEVIAAETWRREFFRGAVTERRTDAKKAAEALARRVIEWSGTARPVALRHDAAEAILIGFWRIRLLNWAVDLPRI